MNDFETQHLLLVDDEAGFREAIAERLTDHGYRVEQAGSGEAALERLGDFAFDILVVDLRLPGGPDGEAMRRLARRYPGIPMLVVTAYPDPPPLPHAGFFSKPFDTGQLLAAVERLHRTQADATAR